MSSRPGPVVRTLPEDMLIAHADVADPPRVDAIGASPSPGDVILAEALLRAAQRPLVLVEGSRWDRSASDALAAFADVAALPVACAFRHQD